MWLYRFTLKGIRDLNYGEDKEQGEDGCWECTLQLVQQIGVAQTDCTYQCAPFEHDYRKPLKDRAFAVR